MELNGSTPTKEKLDQYVKLGLLRSQTNDDDSLTIYVYSEFTQFERLWNSVTRRARGLVVDSKSRCVVRCLPKFFNDDEPEALLEKPRDIDPTCLVVQDKLDGSLIQVANDREHGLVVTSKGSFNSVQALMARRIITEQNLEGDFEAGLTYIFELIHPENRIVIDYGKRRELVLLAVVEAETGKERDIYTARFDAFTRVAKLDPSVLKDVDLLASDTLAEGVVANFGGYRVKLKTAEYLRLHRIVTNFTPKRVWEALSAGDSLAFGGMPEEFQQWLDSTIDELTAAYAAVMAAVADEVKRAEGLTPKELGLSDDYKYKGLVFMVRQGKPIEQAVWKLVKPAAKETVDA